MGTRISVPSPMSDTSATLAMRPSRPSLSRVVLVVVTIVIPLTTLVPRIVSGKPGFFSFQLPRRHGRVLVDLIFSLFFYMLFYTSLCYITTNTPHSSSFQLYSTPLLPSHPPHHPHSALFLFLFSMNHNNLYSIIHFSSFRADQKRTPNLLGSSFPSPIRRSFFLSYLLSTSIYFALVSLYSPSSLSSFSFIRE